MTGDIFGCHMEGREMLRHLVMHRTSDPTTKNDPAPHGNSAAVENSRLRKCGT